MYNFPGPAAQASATAMLDRRRLLIVDDNADAAMMLSMALRHFGHHIETAHSGTDALAAAVRFVPDVVFLDLGMPRMNGFDVARRLRTLPSLARTRIVALTGRTDGASRAAAEAAGFDAYLTKPPNLADIFAVLTPAPTGKTANI